MNKSLRCLSYEGKRNLVMFCFRLICFVLFIEFHSSWSSFKHSAFFSSFLHSLPIRTIFQYNVKVVDIFLFPFQLATFHGVILAKYRTAVNFNSALRALLSDYICTCAHVPVRSHFCACARENLGMWTQEIASVLT